jgi:hypothetical protein
VKWNTSRRKERHGKKLKMEDCENAKKNGDTS